MYGMSDNHSDLLNFGHRLATSCWSAWVAAFNYAEEINSPLLPLINKGCDYAERQKPVPQKYLKAAEQLYQQAIATRALLG